MPYKDEKKRKEYQQKWYAENRKEEIKKSAKRKWKNIEKVRQYLIADKLSKGCYKCDETEPCCLDYHHTGDDKEINIAVALNKGWSKKRIAKEIKKCIVICSNCHRKLHAGYFKIEYVALNRSPLV